MDIDHKRLEKKNPFADGRCEKDELYFENACYYWSKEGDESVSQERAHYEKCKSRKASLASISTAHENAFIARETSPVEGIRYWTGMIYNHTHMHGAFTWLDSFPVAFTKWGMYQPIYQTGKSQSNCVLLGLDGREFLWSVSNCSVKAHYVCKSNFV